MSNVEAQLVNVDSNCPVVIESLNESECSNKYSTSLTSETAISGTLILYIVISMPVMIVILIILTIIIVIIAVVLKRKRESENQKDFA